MKVPVRWLQDLVDVQMSIPDLAHQLTMAGLETEKIEEIGTIWDNVYVGEVRSVTRHPDADRLVLADVEAGEHRLTVVTGAPNIEPRQKVALALAGARLIDAYADEYKLKTLKPGKIRGIESQGMVCSEKELGISEEHEGILVLEPEAPAGVPLKEWLGDSVLEFEVTPNRVDAFSMLGIAREVSAITGAPVRELEVADLQSLPVVDDLITVSEPGLTPRYTAAVIDGLTVAPSPSWMQRRLSAAGIRPISNLVDVTNYVMLELGQPLHAFDLRLFPTGHVIVRPAAEGEQHTTLDHASRTLTPVTTMIANDEVAVGLGGVIGGENSEIVDDTTAILLESATFDMKRVRATSRQQKVRTDASARFERGLDPELAAFAQARAIHLIQELCPEAKVRKYQDVYPEPVQPGSLSFDFNRISKLLGIAVAPDVVLDVLARLHFEPKLEGDTLTVTVPTWRPDVQRREDVIEEVARIVGYDSLPATLITGSSPNVERDPMYLLERSVRNTLVQSGLAEARTYVTVTDQALDAWGGERPPVRLVNPVNADERNMRTSSIPRLIETLVANRKHESSVRMFEIGHVFLHTAPNELPEEPVLLGIAMSGTREAFDRWNPRDHGELDFFDLKGVLEIALARNGAKDAHFEAWEHPMLHPGRSAAIYLGDIRIGFLGEVRPDRARELGVEDQRLSVAEVNLTMMAQHQSVVSRGTITADRFLPVQQDFAVVVDATVPSADVEAALRAGAGPLATSFTLFDLFQGDQLGEGKKSLAWRISFTAPDRALTDAELSKVRSRIEKVLNQRVKGQLRS